MPLIDIPPGRKPTVAVVEIGPMEIAPGVYWRATSMGDDLEGETYAFAFGHGVTQLTAAHRRILREDVAPLLKAADAYTEIYGTADRTGSNAVNFKVAGLRLANVQSALVMAGAPPKLVYGGQNKNLGEEWAATYQEDELADPTERLVLVYTWTSYAASRRIYADLPFVIFARAF